MEFDKSDLLQALQQFNPWWRGERTPDLPNWHRQAFDELVLWVEKPPAPRAVLLAGARQIGKTTLVLQTISHLLDSGAPPQNILYASLDNLLLKQLGLDGILKLWRERVPALPGTEYVFLDEIQFENGWQTWIKHQVDFHKRRRILFTGSALSLSRDQHESGVGRWYTINLATLSFGEYASIRSIPVPALPAIGDFASLFEWTRTDWLDVVHRAQPLVGHFNEYLVRGGFPQCALIDSLSRAQEVLRDDIIDRMLKRDMSQFFGLRLVAQLEHLFLYLCRHNGEIVDLPALCSALEQKRNTVAHYIDVLVAAHLAYQVLPYGYGKEVLRGRSKVYLADPSIAPSVLMRGTSLVEDSAALGHAVEAAIFKHCVTRYWRQVSGFHFWRNVRGLEVDIVFDLQGVPVPVEVKHSSQHTGLGDVKGLVEFCKLRNVERGYLITKELDDFGVMELPRGKTTARILKIPALLACLWFSAAEAAA